MIKQWESKIKITRTIIQGDSLSGNHPYIGGLGHMAIKLAVSKGAEVVAFTTSPSKVNDIKDFGATEAIVVNSAEGLEEGSE